MGGKQEVKVSLISLLIVKLVLLFSLPFRSRGSRVALVSATLFSYAVVNCSRIEGILGSEDCIGSSVFLLAVSAEVPGAVRFWRLRGLALGFACLGLALGGILESGRGSGIVDEVGSGKSEN